MNIRNVLFTGLITVSIGFTQTISIGGNVTDTGGVAIAGAVVTLCKIGLIDTTDVDGSFRFNYNASTKSQTRQLNQQRLSIKITNNVMMVNVAKKSVIEISTYDLQGKILSVVGNVMDAGNHSVLLSGKGTRVYLYKVRSGSNQIIVFGNSIRSASSISSTPCITSNVTKQQAISSVVTDETIAVTKEGYLNYHDLVSNWDTNNIDIKMIGCEGYLMDADSNVYQTVKLGNQIWTVENLRTTKYNDGSAIPHYSEQMDWYHANGTGAYCFYNNSTDPDSCKKFGALYNWFAVDTKKLAPAGWRVPSDADWESLIDFLVHSKYNFDGVSLSSAKSLATKTDWYSYSAAGKVGNNLTENNRSGFSAYPAGVRVSSGYFVENGGSTFWWSTTMKDSTDANYRAFRYWDSVLGNLFCDKFYGYSVRLLKN